MPRTTRTSTTARARCSVAALGLLGLVLAGCSSDRDSDVASLDGNGRSASPQASGPAANADEAMASFRRCMQEQGVPFDASGVSQVPADAKTDPNMAAAAKKCEHFLEGSGVSFETGGGGDKLSPEQLKGLVAYAGCMREQGIDVPDPDPNAGGLLVGRGGPDVDVESPEYKKAHEQCEDELPGVESAGNG